jgi:hypothetical protein
MASLMQRGARFFMQRYADAIEKCGVLHNYYQTAGIPIMQALALLGAGDALRASGQPDLAKERLQQGIAVAMERKCLPVLLSLDLVIAHVHGLRDFEAPSYADSGRASPSVLNPLRMQSLQLKGMRGLRRQAVGGLGHANVARSFKTWKIAFSLDVCSRAAKGALRADAARS